MAYISRDLIVIKVTMFIIVGFIFKMADHLPLLHFLLHVNPLFVKQLPLGERPVHRLHWGLRARSPLPLHAGLLRVVEAEHMALAHDDAVPWENPSQTMCKRNNPNPSSNPSSNPNSNPNYNSNPDRSSKAWFILPRKVLYVGYG